MKTLMTLFLSFGLAHAQVLPAKHQTRAPAFFDELSQKNTIDLLQVCMECHDPDTASGDQVFELESAETFKKQLKADPKLVNLIRDVLRGKDENGKKVPKMPMGYPAFDADVQKTIVKDLEEMSKE